MSIVNDFEITVHAKSVVSKDKYSPCQVNVDSILMTTDIRTEGKDNKDANTRIDLKHIYNTSGSMVTAVQYDPDFWSDTKKHKVQSAIFIKETIEELNALKEDGRKAHLKMLRESRMNIV